MNRLIWVDTETSGLSVETCKLLEIALVITDEELNIIAETSSLVHPQSLDVCQMDHRAREMHLKNGLLSELLLSKHNPTLEAWLERWICAHVLPGLCPMAGATVHFDRAFIKRYLPRVERVFHYRNFDVSTLRRMVQMYFPDAATWVKKDRHRALDDVKDSIEEMKYYKSIIKGKA